VKKEVFWNWNLHMSMFKNGLFCCLVLTLLLNISRVKAQEEDDAWVVHFYPGSVLQLIAPVTDPAKRALRDKYFKTNAETAIAHGYQQDGVLIVDETLIGDFSPNVFVVSHWSSLKAQKTFQSLAQFKDVKSLRREAWEELKLYDHELDKPLTLTFKKDKTYTLAFAWTNPEHPSDYYRYMQSLPPLLEEVGGRFVYQINNAVISAHNPDSLPPQQITLVEWDTKDGVEKLQQLPTFSELAKQLRSGTTRFELHKVSLRN
jgi:heme-degrading monooxygenase HmoA/uncharacterized protein (DUF1330 family)